MNKLSAISTARLTGVKRAGARSEGLSAVFSPLALGAITGPGGLLGAGAAGIAHMANPLRTDAEQLTAEGETWKNALIPGRAWYNMLKRKQFTHSPERNAALAAYGRRQDEGDILEVEQGLWDEIVGQSYQGLSSLMRSRQEAGQSGRTPEEFEAGVMELKDSVQDAGYHMQLAQDLGKVTDQDVSVSDVDILAHQSGHSHKDLRAMVDSLKDN